MNKRQLINESIDYIIENSYEDISIESVAEHFHYSKYYFCRVFKEVTGESLYAFIKRLKMDQSAIELKLEKYKTITAIGTDFGYSASNYSSAFSKHHQVSPYEFRQSAYETSEVSPFYPKGRVDFGTFEDYDARVTVQEMGECFVIYERMIGNYIELREKWFTFMKNYRDYIKEDTIRMERFYNDPAISEVNHCICDLCVTVDKTCKLDNTSTIGGGRFLVYHFSGAIEDIYHTIQGIFRIWMPESGYQMDKRYGLNIYRQVDITHGFVTMDICIPIK